MSEHRRKPPQQPQGGGGRAAARRGTQAPPPGRRTTPPRGNGAGPAAPAAGASGGRRATASHASGGYGGPESGRPSGGRAEARRAAQAASRGGRRRAAGSGADGGSGGGHRGHGGSGGGGGAGRGPGRGGGDGRRRLVNYPRSDRYGWKRWLPSWKLVTGLCIAFFGSLVALTGIALAMVEVPSAEKAADLQQNNVFYWADGTVMGRKGETNRQVVKLDKISKHMQNAAIAGENATFYDDPGIDPKGIARAVFNMATGGDTQGGSTITQQYVKNTFLTQDQTLKRKVKELFISIKVGTTQAKEPILEGYLNTAWYGRGANGIQAAAQAYYGKDAADLNPNESAFLTALLKNANLYNPDGGPENRKRAVGRWNDILNLMVENDYLSQKERDTYEFPEPKKQTADKGQAGQIGYLMTTAENYVQKMSDITAKDLEAGGYQITTTFQKGKVKQLENAVKKVRKEYVNAKERPKTDKHVQFGAASVVPGDGKMVAIYGGENYVEHFSNNADTRGVPVGSTWKPFVLAAAMQDGTYKSDGEGISPESKYNGNDHIKIKDQNGEFILKKDNTPFFQENESDRQWGYVTLHKAMEQSINTPFVQLGMDVGMDRVAEMAESAGISKESFAGLNASFALGTSTPSAIRMADAYATFAASGEQVEPYSVTKVEKDGVEQAGFEKPKTKQAVNDDVANKVTEVLENVIENGTGQRAKALSRHAAGKTGTTDENKSAWWVGYTTQLSTAVTMFREDPKDNGLLSMNGVGGFDSIHGGDLPTQVWTEYMKAALKGQDDVPFPEAGDIGEKQDGDGAPSPTPSLSVDPDPEPSDTPSLPPVSSPPPSLPEPSNSPSDPDCIPGFNCDPTGGQNNGGGQNGGQNGGNTGEPSEPPGSDDGGTVFGQSGDDG